MLKTWSSTILSIAFIFIVCNESFAKEWHGIVPMRSTREDVVRTLNQCDDLNPSCEFKWNHEFVRIEFSTESNPHQCKPELKRDTVLLVEVFPETPIALKKFALDSKIKPVSLSRTTKGYVDDHNGLVLKVGRGKIIQIDYIATLADRTLCSSYYAEPIAFIREPFESHVPVIYLDCPSGSIRAGEIVKVSASLAGTPKISFLWTVNGGRIVSGQGSSLIAIDTAGLQDQKIVVTVKLGRVQSSCELKVVPALHEKSVSRVHAQHVNHFQSCKSCKNTLLERHASQD